MIEAEPASTVPAVDDAAQQAPGVRPEDHGFFTEVLGRSAFHRLLAALEQVIVNDPEMFERL